MEAYLNRNTWDSSLSPLLLELNEKFVKNLPEQQREKIKQLRAATKDVLKPDHTDSFLFKWLQARKFVLKDAETMLRASLKWRNEMGIDTVIEDQYKPIEVMDKYLPVGKLCEDKEGTLVWYINLGKMDIRGLLYSAKKADQIKYYSVIFEMMEKTNNKQSELHGRLITNRFTLIDAENFKIQDYISKPALEILSATIKIMEENFPGCLKKVFIINAPKIFSVLYAMLKPFLSEDNKKKIFIYGKESWKKVLLEAIDASELPVHYGGTAVDEIDGNPYCSSKFGAGGKIPQSYFLKRNKGNTNKDKLQCQTVEKNSAHKVNLRVEKSGSIITWTFETEDHDIGFGISFKPENNKSAEKNYIYPVTRYDCHQAPEEGSLLCDEIGMYTVVFDNRNNSHKIKKLFYDVRVTEPENYNY